MEHRTLVHAALAKKHPFDSNITRRTRAALSTFHRFGLHYSFWATLHYFTLKFEALLRFRPPTVKIFSRLYNLPPRQAFCLQKTWLVDNNPYSPYQHHISQGALQRSGHYCFFKPSRWSWAVKHQPHQAESAEYQLQLNHNYKLKRLKIQYNCSKANSVIVVQHRRLVCCWWEDRLHNKYKFWRAIVEMW